MARRTLISCAVAFAATAALMAGCSASLAPVAQDAAGCPVAIAAMIHTAPPLAGDPATGRWLGRLDRLRDQESGTYQQLADELDWAGAMVALDRFPPQLAIVPAQQTCTVSSDVSGVAPVTALAGARAWLHANMPASRPGMTAGIVTQWAETWFACLAPSHGTEVARGNGCPAWSVTLITATGTMHASCGDAARALACTSATASDSSPDEYYPTVGDELYVPGSGLVTHAADISVISAAPWFAWAAGHDPLPQVPVTAGVR